MNTQPSPRTFRVGVAVLAAVLVWFCLPGIALAHDCSGLSDCFDDLTRILAAGVGIGIAAAAWASGSRDWKSFALPGTLPRGLERTLDWFDEHPGLARNLVSGAMDLIPGVGEWKMAVEAAAGKDLITGQDLAGWQRFIGALPFLHALQEANSTLGATDRLAKGLARGIGSGDAAAVAEARAGLLQRLETLEQRYANAATDAERSEILKEAYQVAQENAGLRERGPDVPAYASTKGSYIPSAGATADETAIGTLLHQNAGTAELPGVEGFRGNPSGVVREGDYVVVDAKGQDVINSETGRPRMWDLYQPRSGNPENIAANAIEKSGQAEVVVIQLKEGNSINVDQSGAERIAERVLNTPDHGVNRVVVIKNDQVIVDRMRTVDPTNPSKVTITAFK